MPVHYDPVLCPGYVSISCGKFGALFLPRAFAKLLFDAPVEIVVELLGMEKEEVVHLKHVLFWDPTQFHMMDNLCIMMRLSMVWDKVQLIKSLLDTSSATCKDMTLYILKNYFYADLDLHRFNLVSIFRKSVSFSIRALLPSMVTMDSHELCLFEILCQKATYYVRVEHIETLKNAISPCVVEEEPLWVGPQDDASEERRWMQDFEHLLFG